MGKKVTGSELIKVVGSTNDEFEISTSDVASVSKAKKD